MSIKDYKESLRINARGYSFDALIMAAMRKANSYNLEALKRAFPEVWEEFFARYHAPGGCLDGKELEAELAEWDRNASN